MKELPNTQNWSPNENSADSLQRIIFEKCKQLELDIKTKLNQEKIFNLNNFDSGVEIESYIRNSNK